jgi:hypothetical protein
MNKTALLIIYNHRYDKNISRLENIYNNRFAHIFHIVPFYDGTLSNVIPVYESSYYFSGYLSQAYTHLKNMGFTHFFVVADDMIINPVLNEENLFKEMGLAEDECYMDYLIKLQELDHPWRQTEAMKYIVKQRGVEVSNILPTIDEVKAQFDKYQIPYSAIPIKPLIERHIKYILKYLLNFRRRHLDYPLVGGYVDILLLTAEMMDKFTLYCGVFAATNLFVELAISTALILSTDKLKFTTDIKFNSGVMWKLQDKKNFGEKYGYNLSRLIENYPEDILYFHPVKLSEWE